MGRHWRTIGLRDAGLWCVVAIARDEVRDGLWFAKALLAEGASRGELTRGVVAHLAGEGASFVEIQWARSFEVDPTKVRRRRARIVGPPIWWASGRIFVNGIDEVQDGEEGWNIAAEAGALTWGRARRFPN